MDELQHAVSRNMHHLSVIENKYKQLWLAPMNSQQVPFYFPHKKSIALLISLDVCQSLISHCSNVREIECTNRVCTDSVAIQMSRHYSSFRQPLKHLKTLWLFTFSDLKTIVGPQTAFGVLSALSGPVLTSNSSPQTVDILRSLPVVAFWVWINLLPFVIDNQRRPKSVEEDSQNKPWRPLPSERISAGHAKLLMQVLYPVAMLVSLYLGAFWQCVALILLGWSYNGLGGADRSIIMRNIINALGYLCFGSGAATVALSQLQTSLNRSAYCWFLVLATVISTTVQVLDMQDQAGDRASSRKTLPIVIGDGLARRSIAIPVAFWSLFCPAFWESAAGAYGISITLGSIICFRTLSKKSVEDDKFTSRIWNIWIVMLYLLPLAKRYSDTVC